MVVETIAGYWYWNRRNRNKEGEKSKKKVFRLELIVHSF